MTTVTEEIETIEGNPDLIHLEGADIDVLVEDLRTRQLFKFLKILTVGAGPLLSELRINADTNQAELAESLIAILVVSIPEAEDEVLEFLQSMVKPVGLIDPEKSKADRAINVEKYTELLKLLDNPLPGDTLDILTRVIKKETPNLIALGKQLAALIPSAAKLTTSSKPRSKKQTPATS